MRRLTISSLLATLAIAAGLLALAPSSHALPAMQPPRQGPACPATCISAETAAAAPDVLLHGEATTVTIHSQMVCAGKAAPMHIAFAVVQSDRLDARQLREIQRSLTWLVRSLQLEDIPLTRVALIEAKDPARTLVAWTADPKQVQRGIQRLSEGGAGALAPAIAEASQQLRRARIAPCPHPAPNEILVLYAAEPEDGRCSEAEKAARLAKSQGMLVMTVCTGSSCGNRRCLGRLASSARYDYLLTETPRCFRVFERIRDEVINLAPRSLEVSETLPPEVDYVAGSARPPARWDPATRQLCWFLSRPSVKGVTLTWQARPLSAGLQPLSRGAELRWTYTGFDPITKTLAPAWAQVFGRP